MAAGPGWQIVPYGEPEHVKRVRVRDGTRIQAVLRHLLADDCVALLGPPLSEKSHLLGDVAEALRATGRFWPLSIDLWRSKSHDEAVFFTSLAWLISEALAAEAGMAPRDPPAVPDARAFQNFLVECANASPHNLALLIDHLQALPHDLVHSLLLALRAAYMERTAVAPREVVAVVAGGMNLVGLSTGPTSPFNIAKPVVVLPLTNEQSAALAEATLAAYGCRVSPAALARIVEWCGGDRYLLPRLCAWSADLVRAHRRPLVTRPTVDRATAGLCAHQADLPPVRAAVRLVEEDPDTMLDVLHLLDHGQLPRGRSRQMPTRTGTDRLQLSGAVVLTDNSYKLLNAAYRRALSGHFTNERVAHVLRIAGRWNEAIEYLAPRLNGQAEALGARPQLLEATVQSIYAADAIERAAELLANGLRLGFGLTEVGVYRALPAQGRLERVHPPDPTPLPLSVDLRDPSCVEAQTYHYGNYALRGGADEARLVVTLAAAGRPIGVVTIEHYTQHRDPHELPGDLPDLLHFLQHVGTALENVLFRAAYRTIGQAVLDARAVQPTVERVLTAVAEALGCDHVALYLADEHRRWIDLAAGVGLPPLEDFGSDAHLPLTGTHPAAGCLQESRMLVARGSDERFDRATVERTGLHKAVRVFLPLRAAAEELGALELGYATSARAALGEERKQVLAAFADQVAIAVHNMQLLRRTDEALARRVAELAVGREIQLSLLPKACPEAPGWEFAAAYQAARTVGGDFYDFCELPGLPPRLGIVIADVADKGVGAALFMALSRTIIRTTAMGGRGPASALMKANELILKDSQAEGVFLSAVYALLELETGRLIYANAGHNPPLLYRAAGGSVAELSQRGIILGTFEGITLGEQRLDLAPGDALVFYTDGVTDALNADGEDFGDGRLREVVASHAASSADALLTSLMDALHAFTGETEQADDVTCVVVRREGLL